LSAAIECVSPAIPAFIPGPFEISEFPAVSIPISVTRDERWLIRAMGPGEKGVSRKRTCSRSTNCPASGSRGPVDLRPSETQDGQHQGPSPAAAERPDDSASVGRGGRQIHKMLPSAFLGIRLAALVLDLRVPRQCCSAPRVMPFVGKFDPQALRSMCGMNAKAQMDAPPKLPAHSPSDPSPRSTSQANSLPQRN
jgi:hypothetical protein